MGLNKNELPHIIVSLWMRLKVSKQLRKNVRQAFGFPLDLKSYNAAVIFGRIAHNVREIPVHRNKNSVQIL